MLPEICDVMLCPPHLDVCDIALPVCACNRPHPLLNLLLQELDLQHTLQGGDASRQRKGSKA